jgi:hypothetical protein
MRAPAGSVEEEMEGDTQAVASLPQGKLGAKGFQESVTGGMLGVAGEVGKQGGDQLLGEARHDLIAAPHPQLTQQLEPPSSVHQSDVSPSA